MDAGWRGERGMGLDAISPGLAAPEPCLPQPTTARHPPSLRYGGQAHAVDSLLSLAANKLLFLESDEVC